MARIMQTARLGKSSGLSSRTEEVTNLKSSGKVDKKDKKKAKKKKHTKRQLSEALVRLLSWLLYFAANSTGWHACCTRGLLLECTLQSKITALEGELVREKAWHAR